jgi:hypothetical protein
MLSAFPGVRAVSSLFVFFLFATPAFSQSVEVLWHIADSPIAALTAGHSPCLKVPEDPEAFLYKPLMATSGTAIPCDSTPLRLTSSLKDSAPGTVAAPVKLANSALPWKPSPVDPGRDSFSAGLAAMGKPGQAILHARDRALEILDSPNACSAWFREKDPNPAATFHTLTFELDDEAQDSILESRDPDSLHIYRQPYVAKVLQGSGAYAVITINPQGAFFRSSARVLETAPDGGGPFNPRGYGFLTVGQYTGGSLSAQVLTLLHELGHILDLLPVDLNDVAGKSVHNTNEVLSHCHSAIESKPGRNGSGGMVTALQAH